MNTDMKLQKVLVEKLKPTKYNSRKDLKPGDPAYKKIKRSMTTYGYVDPVIWNELPTISRAVISGIRCWLRRV